MDATRSDREPLVQIGVGCQLEAFPSQLACGPPSRDEPWSWYLRRRARALRARIGATRLGGLARRLLRGPRPPAPALTLDPAQIVSPVLQAGDRVRVRPAEYIRGTLDATGALKGCAFALGMYPYCGREFRVAKVVGRFFDEARWRMLRARNLVILEGVHCDGASSPDTQGCDRMCFYFWRNEWLERVDDPAAR